MASQILRVSVNGTLPGGEVWSVNPCWELDGSTGVVITQQDALTIATAITALVLPTSLQIMMAANTFWSGARVEARQVTGALDAQAEAVRAVPVNGSGTATHPFQTAAVISLRTSGVGAQYRGRMYWPATGIALGGADYRITSANVASHLSGAKSFLTAIQGAIRATAGVNADLTIWSRKTSTFRNVNALQMGNVVDTQRRRRDTLAEAYQGTTFP